jgi:hypothetical protein
VRPSRVEIGGEYSRGGCGPGTDGSQVRWHRYTRSR